MSTFTDMPNELLVEVFKHCSTIQDATRLARSNCMLYEIWRKHADTIISNILQHEIPAFTQAKAYAIDQIRDASPAKKRGRKHKQPSHKCWVPRVLQNAQVAAQVATLLALWKVNVQPSTPEQERDQHLNLTWRGEPVTDQHLDHTFRYDSYYLFRHLAYAFRQRQHLPKLRAQLLCQKHDDLAFHKVQVEVMFDAETIIRAPWPAKVCMMKSEKHLCDVCDGRNARYPKWLFAYDTFCRALNKTPLEDAEPDESCLDLCGIGAERDGDEYVAASD